MFIQCSNVLFHSHASVTGCHFDYSATVQFLLAGGQGHWQYTVVTMDYLKRLFRSHQCKGFDSGKFMQLVKWQSPIFGTYGM